MIRLLSCIAIAAGLFAFSPLGATAGMTTGASAPLACDSRGGAYCGELRFAQSSCAAAAAAVAREMSGEVIGSPKAVERDGQTMCVVTVLIRDPDGASPPRRERVTVPAR